MDPRLLPFALTDVPRYTSYPTAVQFDGNFAPETADAWISDLPPDASLSIYVHIPFCRKLCWYCGCHTSVPNSYDRAARYVEHLKTDIGRTAALMRGTRNRIRHLHFGGGTPTYLTDIDISKILAAIDDGIGFAAGAEIALESDPRTLTRERAQTLASLGFNRISFGVQDFSLPVQLKINRLQPFGLVKAATDYLRAANFNSVNFDLMYGLPGQTRESVVETARLAAQLEPDRIAVFGYAHVPWFKKHQRLINDVDLPGVNDRYAQAMAITETLEARGYKAIGLDHFARPGDRLARAAQLGTLRRNFQGYTDDVAAALLSFGASAISELPQGYAQASRDLLDWSSAVKQGKSPVNRGLRLTNDDACRAEIIEKLMCNLTVDYGAVAARYGIEASAFPALKEDLQPMIAAGITRLSGSTLTIPEEHRLFMRNIAALFDAYYSATPQRHAKAV